MACQLVGVEESDLIRKIGEILNILDNGREPHVDFDGSSNTIMLVPQLIATIISNLRTEHQIVAEEKEIKEQLLEKGTFKDSHGLAFVGAVVFHREEVPDSDTEPYIRGIDV